MVRSCSVNGCKKRWRKGGVSFFQFPSNPDMCEKWLVSIRRKNFKPSRSSRVCSDHFKESDIVITFGRNSLKKEAIPTIVQPKERIQITRLKNNKVIPKSDMKVKKKAGTISAKRYNTRAAGESNTAATTKINTRDPYIELSTSSRSTNAEKNKIENKDYEETERLLSSAREVIHKQQITIEYLKNENCKLSAQTQNLHLLLAVDSSIINIEIKRLLSKAACGIVEVVHASP